jgi:hypothetical protein
MSCSSPDNVNRVKHSWRTNGRTQQSTFPNRCPSEVMMPYLSFDFDRVRSRAENGNDKRAFSQC